ncbi:hypothetical protein AVEN_160629-1, partial [Araneus ventricosus]
SIDMVAKSTSRSCDMLDRRYVLGYEHTNDTLRRIRLRVENVSVVFTRCVWRIVAVRCRCIFGSRGHLCR